MKKLRLIVQILRQTHTDQMLSGFGVSLLLCSLVIWRVEPDVQTWRDALWYCFTVVSTIGIGNVVVHTTLSRVLSVLLSTYALLVFAIITGIIVNFYNELVALRAKESVAAFLDELEHLDTLSLDELRDLSKRVMKFRIKFLGLPHIMGRERIARIFFVQIVRRFRSNPAGFQESCGSTGLGKLPVTGCPGSMR